MIELMENKNFSLGIFNIYISYDESQRKYIKKTFANTIKEIRSSQNKNNYFSQEIKTDPYKQQS